MAYWSLLGLFVAVLWVICYLMPKAADDYWYSFHLYDYLEGHSSGIPWRAMYDTWHDHYMTDNSRLANIILIGLLIMPKWLAATVPALSAGVMVHFSMRLCRISTSRPAMLMLFILLVSALLPWHELIFSLCYSLNYVTSSALTMVYLYIWLREDNSRTTWGIVTALVLGFMHEGFSLPLLIATSVSIAVTAVTDRRVPLKRVIMSAALVPGVIYLASVPGVSYNMLETEQVTASIHTIARVLKLHLPVLVYIPLLCAVAVRRRSWRTCLAPLPVIIIVGAAVTVYIHYLFPRGYRTGWLAYLLGIVGIMSCLPCLIPRRIKASRTAGILLSIATGLLLGAHYALVISYVDRNRRTHAYIRSEYLRDPSAQIYADLLPIERMSLLAWRKPVANNWNEWARYNFTAYHTRTRKRDQPAVLTVPDVVRDISPSEGRLLPGAARVREIDGYYFARREYVRDGFSLPVRMGKLSKAMYFDCLRFTDINGEEWLWIMPQSCYFPTFLLEMTEVGDWETDNMIEDNAYYD